jgi:cell division protease FtsH
MDEKRKGQSQGKIKVWFIWLFIIIGGLLVANLIWGKASQEKELSYSEFRSELERGNVKEVTIVETEIKGILKNPVPTDRGTETTKFKTRIPYEDPELARELVAMGVEVKARPKQIWWEVVIGYLPWLLLLFFFWILIARQFQAGPNRAFSFGKSRVKILAEDRPKVTFEDVAGVEEAKEELKEVIEFLKNPEKFRRLGARIPKGVLLLGPPGTGKTLLAKAVAGEAKVPFLSISGSDFVELFVGVGAARVRDLFEQAKQHAPCIVFIDEIDAVGRLRGAGLGGGHDEREQTLNQLLVEMDGFDTSEGIVVMAATNRPDILDPALLRPGRFDRQIVVDRPDVKGREEILKIHARTVPLSKEVDLSKIARATPGFSGADLANLVNEAALLAARAGRNEVTMQDFEEAKDKVLMGVARKSMVLSDHEKRQIAYHEAGHVLVSRFLPGTDPIHKVTIIPRGRALGATQQLPVDDRHIYSKSFLLNQLAVRLGGRVAEQVVLGEETTGAGDDLERATELARKMVCEWGMSEKLGPVTIGKVEEEIFIGRELGVKKAYSEEIAKLIDEEIRRFIFEAEEKARKIVIENIDKLHALADKLLEKETLETEEIDEILGFDEKVKSEREVEKN